MRCSEGERKTVGGDIVAKEDTGSRRARESKREKSRLQKHRKEIKAELNAKPKHQAIF